MISEASQKCFELKINNKNTPNKRVIYFELFMYGRNLQYIEEYLMNNYAKKKKKKKKKLSISLGCCSWCMPFNSKDEIVVVYPIESFNSTLSSFLGAKVNEAKTGTTTRVLINCNIGTDDMTKRLEKLKQIRVPCLGREVAYDHQKRILVLVIIG